ncbi:hypothetical protein [Hymenobacter terricola]|uniref:hypothetical protein n=1 Tax=Hymenobacter terricola TaxID=2819236 RepID=UPI001B30A3FD|nr:hypothetical protein [Hymenobacter terricola]
MVSNQQKALKALHKLLVHGRSLAFEGMPSEELAWFFDDLEYLPALMMEVQNTDERFESHLEGICTKFNCSHIFSLHQKGIST